jgi:hypothetical protein
VALSPGAGDPKGTKQRFEIGNNEEGFALMMFDSAGGRGAELGFDKNRNFMGVFDRAGKAGATKP